MLNKTIIKNMLNVKRTAIDHVTFNPDGILSIRICPTKGEQCRCGLCRRKVPCYDAGRGTRRWRICDRNTHKIYLESDIPRVNCPKHGIVVCSVSWARHDSSFTYEFGHMAAWLVMNGSRTVAASFMRVAWNTVGPIISRVRQDIDFDPAHRFDGLVSTGVDETSCRRGTSTSQ